MLKTIAIIPARGGSKSIPKKNIKILGNKPLIAYPIELAKSIKNIDRVIVSTDSEEIAVVAKQYGAEVPFIRPFDISQDNTPTLPVLQHAVKYLEETENYKADLIVLLYPTSPFLRRERVEEGIQLLKTEKHHSVIGVVKDWGRYWVNEENKENVEKHVILYPKKRVNRQYYKPLYKEDGAIYFSDYETIILQNKIVDDSNPGFVIVGEDERCDIDTPEDWKRAEERLTK
jgi:CMP-N,N'-diacetyllegionaminic acid synthase